MTPGRSRPRRFPYQNLPPGSAFPFSGPTPSYNLTPAPAPVLTPVPSPIPTPAATDELFKTFIKAYLKSNQGSRQLLAECKQTLKAKGPEVYYGKLHMDCYHFCKQCEIYFETVRATRANRTLFTVFFLCENINVRWAQFKRCNRGKELTPITWTEFKAFLRKNLGEFKSFIDNI